MAEIAVPNPSSGSQPEALPLWRNRDYVLRWSGQTVSTLGTQISLIAFPLLILSLTGSPAKAGIASALRTLPYVVFSLPAGALVDRWDRKRTMIICDSVRAIAMGSIPLALWMGHLSLLQLYLVAVVEGTFNIFFGLSLTASLPRIVGRARLRAAMSQSEGAIQASQLAGPALGGLLYGLGRMVPFLTDAVSYGASVISLFFIRTEFQEEVGGNIGSLRVEIGEGLVWLWNQRLIRTLAFLGATCWIFLSSDTLIVIVLAKHQHASPGTIGLILGLGGVGGVLGSLGASRIQKYLSFRQVVAGAPCLMAIAWPLLAIAPNSLTLGIVAGVLLLLFSVYNVVQFSYRVALIPDKLQGRVNSVFRLIAFTGMPLGMFLSGLLLQGLGGKTTVLVLWLAPVVMGLTALISRDVRAAGTPRGMD